MKSSFALPIVVVAALASSPFSARENLGATYFSGAILLQQCDEDPGPDSFCRGYIQGLADGFTMLAVLESQSYELPGLCIPEGVTSQELVGAVVENLRQNSASHHLPAADFAYPALLQQFPCQPDSTP